MLFERSLKVAYSSLSKFERHLFMKQSKYHHFCIWLRLFCFSIFIFSCKNMCIVHISLRGSPSTSPSKAGDNYSWSCMFVIFSTVSCSDVHGRFTFYCSKTQVATIRFLYFSLLINIRTGFSSFPRFRIGRNLKIWVNSQLLLHRCS